MLPDGAVVSVQRSVETEPAGSQFAGGGYDVERGATLRIDGTSVQAVEWNAPLMAILLYKDSVRNEWAIVATSQSCVVIREHGDPRLLFEPDQPSTIYFEFRLRQGRWVQVPLAQQSIGLKSNLLIWYRDIHTDHVSIAEKDRYFKSTGWTTWKPYLSILKTYERGLGCNRTPSTQTIRDTEDAILAAVEDKGATPEQRDRVNEFLAGTRVLYEYNLSGKPFKWHQDSDPNSVQILYDSFLNDMHSGITPDGQVIYLYSNAGSNKEELELLRASYLKRLSAAGLARYAPE